MRPSQNIRESIGFAGDVDDTSFHVKMSDRKFVSKCLQIARRSLFSHQDELLLFDQKHMSKWHRQVNFLSTQRAIIANFRRKGSHELRHPKCLLPS